MEMCLGDSKATRPLQHYDVVLHAASVSNNSNCYFVQV